MFFSPCRTSGGEPAASQEQEILSGGRDNVFNSDSAAGRVPAELIVHLTGLEVWQRREGIRKMSWGIQCSSCVHNNLSSCRVANVFPGSEKNNCSGTGRPSFSEAHGTSGSDERDVGILRGVDTSLGLTRTKVVCEQVGLFCFVSLVFPDAAKSVAGVMTREYFHTFLHLLLQILLPSFWALQGRDRTFLSHSLT